MTRKSNFLIFQSVQQNKILGTVIKSGNILKFLKLVQEGNLAYSCKYLFDSKDDGKLSDGIAQVFMKRPTGQIEFCRLHFKIHHLDILFCTKENKVIRI